MVLLWRSYLPYHFARLVRAAQHPVLADLRVVGMQVTADSFGYEFLHQTQARPDLITCLPGASFGETTRGQVYEATLAALHRLAPSFLFSPAVPFPEGMAAVRYAQRTGARVIVMDDSWERTDRRGGLVRAVKRAVHECVDGAFVPDAWYAGYFEQLGIPPDRVVHPVDVIDNDVYTRPVGGDQPGRAGFLFVGRDLPRKGLQTLLQAYAGYRNETACPWPLRVVGPGAGQAAHDDGVDWLGPRVGAELLQQYWSAKALVVPSDYDQWGLVVNEGMAASLPVVASSGVGAARSLVRDGTTGWTFPAGDIAALTRCLLSVSSLDPHELHLMGEAARDKVQSGFSLDRFVHALNRARNLDPRRPPSLSGRVMSWAWRGHMRAY